MGLGGSAIVLGEREFGGSLIQSQGCSGLFLFRSAASKSKRSSGVCVSGHASSECSIAGARLVSETVYNYIYIYNIIYNYV